MFFGTIRWIIKNSGARNTKFIHLSLLKENIIKQDFFTFCEISAMWVETIDIKTKTSFLFQQKVKNILIFTNDRIDVANSILSSSTFIYFRYFTNWYRLHILWLTSIFEKEENNVNTSAIINISIDSKTKKRKRKYSHNLISTNRASAKKDRTKNKFEISDNNRIKRGRKSRSFSSLLPTIDSTNSISSALSIARIPSEFLFKSKFAESRPIIIQSDS